MSRTYQTSSIEYANARIRGHRKDLFKAADYDSLLASESVDRYVVSLGGTKYRSFLDEVLVLHKGIDAVGLATSQFVIAEFKMCLDLMPEQYKKSLLVLGSYWDYQDFKMVVRSVRAGVSKDEIVSQFSGPATTIDRDLLTVLANQENLEDLMSIAYMRSVPFIKGIRLEDEVVVIPEAYIEFEAMLDQAYFENALNELGAFSERKSLVKEYFQEQIDLRNLMTILRIVRSASSFTEEGEEAFYFIEGGDLIPDLAYFKELAELGSVEELSAVLRPSPEKKVLAKEIPEYILSDSLASINRALEIHFLKDLVKRGKRDLLGPGLATAYMLALIAEAQNLRLIAHAKSFGISEETVREELVLLA